MASGTAKYHGDLKQIGRWLQDPRLPPRFDWAGQIDGQAEIKQQGECGRGQDRDPLIAAM